MPELPDILTYLDALETRVRGQALRSVRIVSPFVLRTFDPPVDSIEGHTVQSLSRLGKRIVLHFDGDLHLVIHLMIAGRLRWEDAEAAPGKRVTRSTVKRGRNKIELASFGFDHGILTLTEASDKKRASIHVVRGEAGLREHDPGGADVMEMDLADFAAAIRHENHTIKRVLTDPRVFSGIGNAYSDEILHAARLSPLALSQKLTDEEIARLLEAVRATLLIWTARLRGQFAGRFPGPGEITAFRPDFAVHGKFGKPCPACGKRIQRIRYADNETNYCAICQTGGRRLADRSMSRLLKDDWPREVE